MDEATRMPVKESSMLLGALLSFLIMAALAINHLIN
jgi:hypothetical protein